VADYTRHLAGGLAAAGDEVHVWAPACEPPEARFPGVDVHRLPGHYGPQALLRLQDELHQQRRPFRVLVQYVPHMYGWKAMNLAFCTWLRFGCPVAPWVMFHEVAFPCRRGQRLRHNLLGAVNRLMAAMVARAAERIFVSTPACTAVLGSLAPGRRAPHWLPVPSNVPTQAAAAAVLAVRAEVGGDRGRLVIGHFGTFGGPVAEQLTTALPPLLLADGARVGLLVGRGSVAFAERLVREQPALTGRLKARGDGTGEAVAASLKACDLLVQPYPDGVSARRGSLMAGLALGVPAVTTQGSATEPVWQREALVALAPSGNPRALVASAERLLADPAGRRELGARGAAGYARHFSIENTVRALRAAPPWHEQRTPPKPS
jgi:hypothetical protein